MINVSVFGLRLNDKHLKYKNFTSKYQAKYLPLLPKKNPCPFVQFIVKKTITSQKPPSPHKPYSPPSPPEKNKPPSANHHPLQMNPFPFPKLASLKHRTPSHFSTPAPRHSLHTEKGSAKLSPAPLFFHFP